MKVEGEAANQSGWSRPRLSDSYKDEYLLYLLTHLGKRQGHDAVHSYLHSVDDDDNGDKRSLHQHRLYGTSRWQELPRPLRRMESVDPREGLWQMGSVSDDSWKIVDSMHVVSRSQRHVNFFEGEGSNGGFANYLLC